MQLLGITNYHKIFYVQAVLNTIYAFVVLFILKDIKEEEEITLERPNIIKGLKAIAKVNISLLLFLLSLAFITMGATNLDKYIDVYFNNLQYLPEDLGLFKMITGFVSLLASLTVAQLFVRFKKQLLTMILIQIINAAVVFYVFRASDFILTAYTVYMIFIIFRAVHQPLEQNYISLHAKKGEYGKIMGIRQSFVSLGMIIGPLIGGFIFQRSSLALFDSSAVTFIIGGLLLVIVIILEIRSKNKKTNEDII